MYTVYDCKLGNFLAKNTMYLYTNKEYGDHVGVLVVTVSSAGL